jgi:hypothetical protein
MFVGVSRGRHFSRWLSVVGHSFATGESCPLTVRIKLKLPHRLLLTIFALAYHSSCAFPQSTCVTTIIHPSIF